MVCKWSLNTTIALASMLPLLCLADSGWTADDDDDTGYHQQHGVAPALNPNQPNIQQLSEAFGHLIGQDISKQGIHFDVEAVIEGIRNGVAGNPAPMSENDYDDVVANFRNKHFQEIANFNLALADAFMISNGKRQDIVQAVPGKVQYVVIQQGRGAPIHARTSPQLKFTGRFIDGTVFTATENNQAVLVPLEEMIAGFREGVVGMREGEKRRIFIHPDAAYGVTGELAPNSLLLFEVEAIKAGDRVQPQSSNRKQQLQTPMSQQSQPQQDDWDLKLEDSNGDVALEDNFSSKRLILQPVSDRQHQPNQIRSQQKQQGPKNTRPRGNE